MNFRILFFIIFNTLNFYFAQTRYVFDDKYGKTFVVDLFDEPSYTPKSYFKINPLLTYNSIAGLASNIGYSYYFKKKSLIEFDTYFNLGILPDSYYGFDVSIKPTTLKPIIKINKPIDFKVNYGYQFSEKITKKEYSFKFRQISNVIYYSKIQKSYLNKRFVLSGLEVMYEGDYTDVKRVSTPDYIQSGVNKGNYYNDDYYINNHYNLVLNLGLLGQKISSFSWFCDDFKMSQTSIFSYYFQMSYSVYDNIKFFHSHELSDQDYVWKPITKSDNKYLSKPFGFKIGLSYEAWYKFHSFGIKYGIEYGKRPTFNATYLEPDDKNLLILNISILYGKNSWKEKKKYSMNNKIISF